MAKTRIEELKTQMYNTQLSDLTIKHEEERQIVEREYSREISAFNSHWDTNQREFNSQADDIKKNLQVKQLEEFESFATELEKITPTKPKDSTKLLNLKKTQESLAKQQKFGTEI